MIGNMESVKLIFSLSVICILYFFFSIAAAKRVVLFEDVNVAFLIVSRLPTTKTFSFARVMAV